MTPASITLPAPLRLSDRALAAGTTIRYAEIAEGTTAVRVVNADGSKGAGFTVAAGDFRTALQKCGRTMDSAVAARLSGIEGKRPDKAFNARASHLGHVRACGRCGGGGHWSYCPGRGTLCFDCDGRGIVRAPITEAVALDVAARTAAGQLEDYFAAIKATGEAKRAITPLLRAINEAWAGVGSVHEDTKWERKMPHALVAQWVDSSANFRAITLVNALWDLANKVDWGFQFDGRRDWPAMVAELTAILDTIRAVNTEWARYDGADRMHPTTEAEKALAAA